jgi:uncharacterized membrane protein
MAKRTKVLGLPIGPRRKRSVPVGRVARAAAPIAAGTLAATYAVRRAGSIRGAVDKGKGAVGDVADAAKRISDAGSAVGEARTPFGKAAALLRTFGDAGRGPGGDGAEDSPGHDKKLAHHIEEHIDVGVNRREVYNQWTQFREFEEIFGGVEGVDHPDGESDRTAWRGKVWLSRRQWEAEITHQVPDKRIAWKSTGGVDVRGVVTFHSLDEDLTRIHVQMLYRPHGAIEHIANLFRAARRRTRKDLKLFKHFMELRDEATGSWRGRIRKDEGRGDAAIEGGTSGDGTTDGDRQSGSSSTKGGSSASGRRSA